MVEELHGRCAVVIMSGGPLRILDWVCGWLRGFDRVGVGGIEGQKKKTKTREKKRREKKYGEKWFWQPAAGDRAANPVQPSGSFNRS